MERFDGVIFDFNGTLLFDSKMHLEAWREFSAKLRGTPFSDKEMREHMFGRTNKDIIAYAIGKIPDDKLVKELGDEKELLYRNRCRAMGEKCTLAPFAEDFLNYLKENNIPRTIATMSNKDNVDFYIEHFNLEKWFDIDKIVYDNGKIKGKPEPDIYLKASENLNLSPTDCIVIEDAVSGIKSASNANIGKIVAIASMEPIELYQAMPEVNLIIKDFHEFDKILRKEPLYNKV